MSVRFALTAVPVLLSAAGCGDSLPAGWPPGTYCGLAEPPKVLPADAGTWSGAIVNGEAEPDPAVVRLTEAQKLAVGALLYGLTGGNFCTGTLVGDDAVLTAAHCVDGMIADNIGFAVGPDAASPLHVFRIAAVHVNPSWSGSAAHDNAVLVLRGPASGEFPDVDPIDWNADPLEDLVPAFVGRDVQNVGYGSTVPGGGGDNTLRWWTVEEIADLRTYSYDTDGHGISAVCFGDSGSPTLVTFPDGRVRTVGTLQGGDASCTDVDTFARTDADAAFIAPLVTPVPGCRYGLVGRCAGDVAEWCVGEEDGDLRREDCAATQRVCGRTADGLNRCLAGRRCPDGLGFTGRCDPDDIAVWCDVEHDVLRTRHCRPCGQVCAWVDSSVGYDCTDP